MKLSDLTKDELIEKLFYLECREKEIENPQYLNKLNAYLADQKHKYENHYSHRLGGAKRILECLSNEIKEKTLPEINSVMEKEKDNAYLLADPSFYLDCGIISSIKKDLEILTRIQNELSLAYTSQQTSLDFLNNYVCPEEYSIYRISIAIAESYYPKFDVCRDDTVMVYYRNTKDGERYNQTCKVHFINNFLVAAQIVNTYPSYSFTAPSPDSQYPFHFLGMELVKKGEYWDTFDKILEND